MWGKSGDILHRSPLNKLMNHRPVDPELPDIKEWGEKIRKLLNEHFIVLEQDEQAETSTALLVAIQAFDTGKPHATFMTLDHKNKTMSVQAFKAT